MSLYRKTSWPQGFVWWIRAWTRRGREMLRFGSYSGLIAELLLTAVSELTSNSIFCPCAINLLSQLEFIIS